MSAIGAFKRLFTHQPLDPVRFWRARADAPGLQSVMWSNDAYNECAQRDQWDAIRRLLPEHRDAVLDLGCGTGRLTSALASLFNQYVGVDLDTMVAEARRRNPGVRADFVSASVQEYDFPADRFDLVLSMACIASACTAAELPDAAARMYRATRPGGRILLIDPFHRLPILTRTCRMTASEVSAVFTQLGARRVAWTAIHFIPVRLLLARRSGHRPLTRWSYAVGERLAAIAPRRLADYQVIAFDKPAGAALAQRNRRTSVRK